MYSTKRTLCQICTKKVFGLHASEVNSEVLLLKTMWLIQNVDDYPGSDNVKHLKLLAAECSMNEITC